jgi:hypothetical protein
VNDTKNPKLSTEKKRALGRGLMTWSFISLVMFTQFLRRNVVAIRHVAEDTMHFSYLNMLGRQAGRTVQQQNIVAVAQSRSPWISVDVKNDVKYFLEKDGAATHTLTHSHTHTLTHSYIHTFTHSLTFTGQVLNADAFKSMLSRQ